ncbi:MAG: phytanoyl-CoA dioxygenase family protein [Trichodesmium sp. MO_231.B1]|nr:phytanoyl-CoA dioxygenase family protein [Trichodesmium sp. MO_231.B1]
MKLTTEQIDQYNNQGFLLIPDLFSQEEVSLMQAQLPSLMAEDVPGQVLEKDRKTVRALHGCHLFNKVFHNLIREPRLLEPAHQLLGSQVCIHQFKINLKAAFGGDIWPWHQDFIYWHKEDGMPLPKVISLAILLDDLNEFNGPMIFIPGSHKQGMLDVEASVAKTEANPETADWKVNVSANLKYCIPPQTVRQLVKKLGIFAPKGTAGSILLFDSNVVHGSVTNISPFPRRLLIITYNSVENIPVSVDRPRPEFLVCRDYKPLKPIADSESLLSAQ